MFLVLLTVYKRNYLEQQLKAINNQSVKPDIIVVYQNENHINIEDLKKKYNFMHVKNDYNTKYFGRFFYCLNFNVDYVIIMDDDIIPAENCFKKYLQECKRLNGIIGGNGRIGYNNKKLYQPPDVGIRKQTTLVDFVGHLWCVKLEWIRNMASIKPYTLDTGEDMHLCYSNKVLNNISSYCCGQEKDEMCDITMNRLASDVHASYKKTPTDLRVKVEKYFIDNFNLKLINDNK